MSPKPSLATPQPRVTEAPSTSRIILLALLAVLAAGFFVVRGPMRAVDRGGSGGNDLAHVYAASRVWMQGGNPYDGNACIEALARAGGPAGERMESLATYGSLYPPTTFPMLAPIAWMDWPAARVAWLVVNLAAVAGLIAGIAAMLGTGDRRQEVANGVCRMGHEVCPNLTYPTPDPSSHIFRGWVAAIVVLAWAPVHTSLALGQLSAVAAAGVVAGLALAGLAAATKQENQEIKKPGNQKGNGKRNALAWALPGALPGVLVGVAAAVKPQMALGFVVLLVLLRHYRAAGWAVGVFALMLVLSIARLQVTAPTWASDMARNMALFADAGAMGDPSSASALRYQMIDLRPIAHALIPAPAIARLTTWLIVGLAGAAAIYRLMKPGPRMGSLYGVLPGAGVAVLSLMPVYHRFYDATLLLIVIAWVIGRLVENKRDAVAWVAAAALAPFLIPGAAALATLVHRGVIPPAIAGSWAWQTFVMQHQSWCVLVLLGCLLAAVFRDRRESLGPRQRQATLTPDA